MNGYFSIGELSKLQNISRQTLIFYDKIGLFHPNRVDAGNGYRYYSAGQLDELDTILILKKIGFSLEEIRSHMKNYTSDRSIAALRRQVEVIEAQIEELQMTKSRVVHRCAQLERSLAIRAGNTEVCVERVERQYVLSRRIASPYTLDDASVATKECFVRAFREKLPILFQSGVIVPYENVRRGRYTEATVAYLTLEKKVEAEGVLELPAGRCVSTYHVGDYPSIGRAYERVLRYCAEKGLRIASDSYEFAIDDYLSTGNEAEYVTKIQFYLA